MVTIETVKFIQAIFISNDKKMYVEKSDMFVSVQSSNLNEELGQISYVFSDKTGTLTCNEMIFKKLIVDGNPFGLQEDPSCISRLKKVSNVDFSDPTFISDAASPTKAYLRLTQHVPALPRDLPRHPHREERKRSHLQLFLARRNRAGQLLADARLRVRRPFGAQRHPAHDQRQELQAQAALQLRVHQRPVRRPDPSKKQSVLFLDEDGSIKLYTKGADSFIFKIAKPGQLEE